MMDDKILLLALLEGNKGDKNKQAIILQDYISNVGPIPKSIENTVRELLK